MAAQSRTKHVALALPISAPWVALCANGIREYAQEHGGWNLLTILAPTFGAEEFPVNISGLKDWQGDGIIAFISTRREEQDAQKMGIPIVSLSNLFSDSNLHRVVLDQHAVGRLGAEHLLDCGVRRLAYYGIEGLLYSQRRCQGFVDRAAEAGVSCDVYEQPLSKAKMTWQEWLLPVHGWLQTLKKPVGILAAHDFRARILLEACIRLGLNVPADIAILGVDNDPTVCENCRPTISSIYRPGWKIGYQAAAVLHQLMLGTSVPQKEYVLPPEGIALRGSTDMIAVEDARVNAAVHYMRDHLAEIEGINSVTPQVGVSRRCLEKEFQRLLGCTPYQYLCRLRVEKAKALLSGSERLKMRAIATACGFTSIFHLRSSFLRAIGTLPSAYRQMCERRRAGLNPEGGRLPRRPRRRPLKKSPND